MMKKLFTSLLLLTALLCSSVAFAEETVFTSGEYENYKIIKVADNDYRIEPQVKTTPIRINSNQFGNANDWTTSTGRNDFMSCTGKITLIGYYESIDGLNNSTLGSYTNVDLSQFSIPEQDVQLKVVDQEAWQEGAPNYTYHNEVSHYETVRGGFTAQKQLKNYFPNATTVVMPAEETIYQGVFSDHNKIQNLSFSNVTTVIYDSGTAVLGNQPNTTLTSVTLPSGLTKLGQNIFRHCQGLTSIVLPTSLVEIGGEAFGDSGLTGKVDLSGLTSLTTIGHEAFEGCGGVTEFVFPTNGVLTTIGNDAFKQTGITTLNMRGCTGITKFGSNAGKYKTFYQCTSLKTVVLPPNLTEIPDDEGNGVFAGCTGIQSVEFTGTAVYDNNCNQTEASKLRIGDKAFKDIATLDSVKLSNNVTYIGQYSFSQTGIRTIHIPASVELIRDQAFENCDALTIVVFDAIDDCNCGTTEQKAVGKATVIEGGSGSGAFNNSEQITDVYVNTTTPLNCENYAFDAAITWGRGDAAAGFATLHFPEDQLNHYVNTEHFLTNQIMLDPGLFHDWLMDHMEQALGKEPEKGWWEFINAGPMKTNIEEEPTYPDIMLRTFSDNNISYLVPDGLRAYIVNGIQKAKDKNGQETGNYELILQRLYVIPAKTGVILYGHPNGRNLKGKPILSMTPITFAGSGESVTVNGNTYTGGANEGKPLCRANWNLLTEADQEYKNYLEPTNGAVELKPYERYNNDPTQPVMYRNFIMSRFKTTKYEGANQAADDANYMGFFRVVKGTYPSGYAYLKLAGDVNEEGKPFPIKDATGKVIADTEYASASGNEILVKEDPEYNHERNIKSGELYDATADGVLGGEMNPRRWWDPTHNPAFTWNETTKSWGLRSNKFAANDVLTIDWEIEEEADGIVKLIIHDETNTAGDYYTLQGVKVINPTKGVYIRNGKKVIVK